MERTHIGFTGTQEGCTDEQFGQLRAELMGAPGHDHVGHHGDCIGADAQFHSLVYYLGWLIEIHPSIMDNKRAFCADGEERTPSTVVHEGKGPLIRNRDIVDASVLTIACPKGPETLRSGTWATIRYADHLGKAVTIIYPDGTVDRRNWGQA